jgi:hypothetical protein
MSTQNLLEAYDVYVFKSDGLPVLSGCTGSDYCMTHMTNHELHTAFMAALQSFSREAFADNTVQTVMMQDFQLNMQIFHDGKFILGAVHNSEIDTKKVQKKINEAVQLFREKFESNLDDKFIDQMKFSSFVQDLENLELLPQNKFLENTDEMRKKKSLKLVFTRRWNLVRRIRAIL